MEYLTVQSFKLVAVYLTILIIIQCTNCASYKATTHENVNPVTFTSSTTSSATTTESTKSFSKTSETPMGNKNLRSLTQTQVNKKQQKNNSLIQRQPKFGLNGFNFTMPGLTMNSIDTDTFLGPTGLFFSGTNGANSDKTGSNMLGDLATIAAPIVLLKGVSVAAIKILKTLILPPIFFLVLLAFLIAGAAFFASAFINGNGAGGFQNAFSRNTYEFEQPVHNALDNAYHKYGYYYGNPNNYVYDKMAAASAAVPMSSSNTEDYSFTYPPYTQYTSHSSYNSLAKKDNDYKIIRS